MPRAASSERFGRIDSRRGNSQGRTLPMSGITSSRLPRSLWICGLATLALLSGVRPSSAVPRDIAPGSRLEFSFNVIGYPEGQTYTGGCGEGHRIFVNRGASNAHVLVKIYDIYVRILGKPGGRINICADTFEDFQSGETLCLLGTIDLTRGKGQSKFQLAPSAMFDASLEDIMWTIQTNSNFRIAQFRVYQRP
jgi:hypothetical protein